MTYQFVPDPVTDPFSVCFHDGSKRARDLSGPAEKSRAVMGDLWWRAIDISGHFYTGISRREDIVASFKDRRGALAAKQAGELLDICDGRFPNMQLWTRKVNGEYVFEA